MAIELKVPEVGESITEVMIGVWKKNVGDSVSADESVVEIESDKTIEKAGKVTGSLFLIFIIKEDAIYLKLSLMPVTKLLLGLKKIIMLRS